LKADTLSKNEKEHQHMIQGKKALWIVLSVGFLVVSVVSAYFLSQRGLSLPFRQTNDMLHKMDSPVTLDFLIPSGFYIDQKVTIGEVVQHRFQKPGNRLALALTRISESVPARYRYTGTVLLYLFWTFLFLVFYRLFTWMTYASALRMSFLCGAILYFFMPDLVMGRLDDGAFLVWAMALLVMALWLRKRRAGKKP
jgi:hypothetical protein